MKSLLLLAKSNQIQLLNQLVSLVKNSKNGPFEKILLLLKINFVNIRVIHLYYRDLKILDGEIIAFPKIPQCLFKCFYLCL